MAQSSEKISSEVLLLLELLNIYLYCMPTCVITYNTALLCFAQQIHIHSLLKTYWLRHPISRSPEDTHSFSYSYKILSQLSLKVWTNIKYYEREREKKKEENKWKLVYSVNVHTWPWKKSNVGRPYFVSIMSCKARVGTPDLHITLIISYIHSPFLQSVPHLGWIPCLQFWSKSSFLRNHTLEALPL